MLGYAAYCPTTLTGKGTGLALVSAYVLAGGIKWDAHYAEAFHTYEARVRPMSHASQKG